MATITYEKLGRVGARVVGATPELLRDDDSFAAQCLDVLEENGVLVFPELHIDDASQAAFTRKLGTPVPFRRPKENPEIWPVSLDPQKNPSAEYLRGTVLWHIDGAQDTIPAKATLLSGKVVSETGGETEFASTYVAYDELSDEEKERFADVRVIHSLSGTQRKMFPNPTPEQLAAWAKQPDREHPLVWQHRSGKRSLVIGSTAVEVVGMPDDQGIALLDELLDRATTPDHVYRHEWTVGDMVIWDNRGVLHRVQPYDPDSGREMHRSTIEGDEPIQ
jgi:alpha-ketoglutarate-dependent taurine dioxygenase